MVSLGHLLERVDHKWNAVLHWEDVLSLGEQQRMAMARLFYHRPSVAILDECSSALNVEFEQQFYMHCQRLGIKYISVGHRPGLIEYHDTLLMMDNEGAWKVSTIEHER